MATVNAMRLLGVSIRETGPAEITIGGVGLTGLKPPPATIDCGNSGTTMRLLMGILAGQDFSSRLTGDQYLRKRPMDRVIRPLRQMGAKLRSLNDDLAKGLAPIEIEGAPLSPISYNSPIASAQVKSAVLLAGLYCQGKTTVSEPYKSRDHTERMLHRFGARVEVESLRVSVNGPASLRAEEIVVPGDISSAAFFLAAAAMISGSELLLRNVGLNRTRTGFLSLLRRMGADIFGADTRDDGLNEPSGNITVRGTDKLKAVHIGAEDIPALIDEVPILAVTALRADGTTVIEGASELRVKETDRLSALAKNLSALGTRVKEEPDGLIIDGPQRICGGTVDSFGDHRIAMAMAVAGLIADGPVTITDTDCVATSFPGFFEVIRKVTWQE